MKIIFFVLIFFFVGWMAVTLTGLDEYFLQQNREAAQGMRYAGTINGQTIDRAAFDQQVQNTVAYATNQRAGASLSAMEVDQLSEQVWSELVNQIIFSEVYKKHQIEVSDAEVIEYVKNNPLPELMRHPDLQTDGRFDYNKYISFLSDPRQAPNIVGLEQDARSKIPNFKLFLDISSFFKLTETELVNTVKQIDEKVQVSYVRFVSDDLIEDTAVEVSAEEIQAYYTDNQELFKRPETADLSYIRIPLTPGSIDSALALDTLAIIADMLKAGQPWDSVAAHYSQGILASSGGDLGWFAKGDYTDEEMVKKAFALKRGRTSAGFLSADGYQILRVDSTRTSAGKRQVKARRILRKIEAGSRRTAQIRARARNLRKLGRATEDGFASTAADSGFSVGQTGEFTLGSRIPGLDSGRDLTDYVYSAKDGNISYPIVTFGPQSADERFVTLVRVDARHRSGDISLDEATGDIRNLLISRKKQELASAKIRQEILPGYANAESLADFAKANELVLYQPAEFSRASGLAEVSPGDNAFVGTAFGLAVGGRSELIEVDDNFYLLEVISHSEADMTILEQSREQLVQQLRNQKFQTIYAQFNAELVERSTIEDLRKISPPDSLAQTVAGGNAR